MTCAADLDHHQLEAMVEKGYVRTAEERARWRSLLPGLVEEAVQRTSTAPAAGRPGDVLLARALELVTRDADSQWAERVAHRLMSITCWDEKDRLDVCALPVLGQLFEHCSENSQAMIIARIEALSKLPTTPLHLLLRALRRPAATSARVAPDLRDEIVELCRQAGLRVRDELATEKELQAASALMQDLALARLDEGPTRLAIRELRRLTRVSRPWQGQNGLLRAMSTYEKLSTRRLSCSGMRAQICSG